MSIEYPIIGVIYKWKGLKEENYLYTMEEMWERDSKLLIKCLQQPGVLQDDEGGSGNRTRVGILLTDQGMVKNFLQYEYNEPADGNNGDYYIENRGDDLYCLTDKTALRKALLEMSGQIM